METKISNLPNGLMEAIRHYSDPMVCLNEVASGKWPKGQPVCPKCGGKRHSFLKTRLMWKCLECKKQFSVKVGTIFEDSPIGLDKWLCAMWMLASCKNGVSSYEVADALRVTQKTAWFMLHRIRYAMHHGTINKMSGEVKADETFVGGKARNMHIGKRKTMRGRSLFGKMVVFGLLERETGEVRTAVVLDRDEATLQGHIHHNVRRRAHLMTDEHLAYEGLGTDYAHNVINHAESYVGTFTRTGWRTSGRS